MIPTILTSILYVFLFVTLYLQVFFIITFFEEREGLALAPKKTKLSYYPSTTIIIPCWNEEKTVGATIRSVLNLNYPKNKLNIVVVDDGSTDKTAEVAESFTKNPQITLIKKENGGKDTALNTAIATIKTELIGCLDADSFVDKDALTEIARAFNGDPLLMAATPMLIIHEPKTIIQKMQKTEYHLGAFLKRMLSSSDGLNVTPGPLSIFRKEVFEKIGLYKKAHNVEDMEFALRMQANHMRIRNIHTAHVYTSGPKTLYRLYKQRLRWTYGTMKNTIDYRFMIFKREYGVLGMITLPLSFVGVFIFLYNFGFMLFRIGHTAFDKITQISVVGPSLTLPTFDSFFFNTNVMAILWYVFLFISLAFIWHGVKLAEGRFRPSMSIVYFIVLYMLIAPLWITRTIFNLAFSQSTTWR
ncbi:MAG: glycosyltransferase [Candidatus Pacebacteria bacterium]|nr:glycosyltransferase [Candidatus Paceibacterota bacterium]